MANLGVQVFEQLRADVLRGRFEPGSPLRLAPLAEQYGTSMSVVREALSRLAGQHLAVLTPNAGFRLPAVSRDDLVDLTDLRVQLEGRAIELSVQRGDVAWEADVVAAHHRLERTVIERADGLGSSEQWSVLHSAFHEALVAACQSPRLIELTRSLRDSAELYRQLSSVGTVPDRRDIAGEHRELLDLAIGRRAAEAAASLERHLRITSDRILGAVLVQAEGAVL